ncbi:MAG: DUF1080 domain-containing protein [Verrucomicrobiales bacterium]|nr:DUF1080 domain-containing protein [Verrucomicrobiales bacterium]
MLSRFSVFFAVLSLLPGTFFSQNEEAGKAFHGNWALVMPDGAAGWMKIFENEERKLDGQIWMVGAPKPLTEISITDGKLNFTHKRAVGEPEYVGGPFTGKKIPLKHLATVSGDGMTLAFKKPDGEKISFTGKRMPPLPSKPDLTKVEFGEPIELFNGKDLTGWRLTNPKQKIGWKAVDGELVNETPKKTFDPFARYGNLRTDREFTDFNLQIEFNVPEGGNSGIYLRGMYEAQVVDRDSRMQGIHGVGAIFNRIEPSEMAGKKGGEWQKYDLTLVDRHVTVILNGKKIIDNHPIEGCTNGALWSDETRPGPLYLQGDHTSVRYRNIVLRPVVKKN